MLVYKYRTVEKRTLEILLKKKLFFSNYINLNDPLDSSVDIEKEYIRTKNEIEKIDNTKDARLSFIYFLINRPKEFIDKTTKKEITLNEALNQYISNVGILSLSKNPTEPLIWAHYADGHRGVSFGFESTELNIERVFINESIKYKKEPPYRQIFIDLTKELSTIIRPGDGHKHSDKEVDDFYTKQLDVLIKGNLLVKSTNWKYESEFRLVSGKSGLLSYNPYSLKQIIFGCKTSKEDIESIKEIIKLPEYKHVKTYIVKPKEGTFTFDLIEYV